MTGNTK